MKVELQADEINWRQVKRFLLLCLCIVLIFIAFAKLYQALVVPIGISLFLTYLLAPLVNKLNSKRLPRELLISLLLLFTLSLIAFASIRVIPTLYYEIVGLVKLAPAVYETFVNTWLPSLRETVLAWGIVTPDEFSDFVRELRQLAHVSERINQAMATIWNSAPQVLGTVVNIVMVPLLTFFLLKDYKQIKAKINLLLPRDLEKPSHILASRISGTLRDVIRGQSIVAGILAILYVIGLSLIGLHAAVAIGLVAGLCRMIPYLDVLVGGTLSLIVVLSDFNGIAQLLGVCGVFLVVQSLDGMFITPRIIGERVGLHPLVVIVSILAFGDLFGFWGVLFAIPALAVAKVLWLSIKPYYLASKAYKI